MTDNTDLITDRAKKEPLIYEELSYKIVGLAYEVYNSLGEGLKEESYKLAYSTLLEKENIAFIRELYHPLKIRGDIVAKKFFDFLIHDKIVIEFKVGDRGYRNAYVQLLDYLKNSKYKLGLIIRFTSDGVKIKRIANIY
jgi:GxxExxY protein